MANSLLIIHIHISNDKEQERKCFWPKHYIFTIQIFFFLVITFHRSFLHYFSKRRFSLKKKTSKPTYQMSKFFSACEGLSCLKSACMHRYFQKCKDKFVTLNMSYIFQEFRKIWRQTAHQTSNLCLCNMKSSVDS